MYLPNADCILFCDWLLTGGYQRFTTTRIEVINEIKTAAEMSNPVIDVDWKNFLIISAPLYPVYLCSKAFASQI
jgi:hypothetical protein